MLGPGEAVIVSGPPGAGKTTVAAALASEQELGVHLESDWFYRVIRAGFVPPYLPEANTQNTVVMDVAADAVAAFARGGYGVVWDGIVGPWFLDRVAERLGAQGVALHYLVLRPDRETALARVRERDGTDEVSGASTMHDQLADLGALEHHAVDAEADLGVVLDRCRAMLADGRLLLDRR